MLIACCNFQLCGEALWSEQLITDFRHVAVLGRLFMPTYHSGAVPRPTRPSIPPGSVNEEQLWLGRQR